MSEVSQSCPTLCDPMDCSLPVSSVHGIFQARVLEWVAMDRGPSYFTVSLVGHKIIYVRPLYQRTIISF